MTVLDDHRHRPSSVLTIADLRATTVTVPLEAPLRHAAGAHWGRFVRTIVEVETTDGIIGLGELGGGGQSAQLAVEALGPRLVGHNVFDLTALWFKICNPTAALYDNRLQVHAAIEFACLDIIGQALDVPVYDLLGGKLRDAVPFASYLFFRYPDPATGRGEVPRRTSSWRRRWSSRSATGFPRTSSRPASFRRSTSWSVSARSPRRFPRTRCGSTRTRHTACPRRSGWARPSRVCGTTTTRTRRGA